MSFSQYADLFAEPQEPELKLAAQVPQLLSSSISPVVQNLNICFSDMLCSFLDQQISHQLNQLQLIQNKIQQYEMETATESKLRGDESGLESEKEEVTSGSEVHSYVQDRSTDGKKKCGRPVTNSALEQKVKQIVKYLENRGLQVTRPLCRLVIEELSGEDWSYGWSRKFMIRYHKERDFIQESSNIPLAERLYDLGTEKAAERSMARGRKKSRRSK